MCFRCTVKTCKERIETNDVIIIVGEYGDHDHSNKASNVAAVALRVSCKHKASKDISQRPSKIIRTDFAPGLWAASPQQSPTTTNAAESFHSHLNADSKTPHPNIYAFLQSLTRQQTYLLTGSLAFTRAPSRTRSQKAAQLQYARRA